MIGIVYLVVYLVIKMKKLISVFVLSFCLGTAMLFCSCFCFSKQIITIGSLAYTNHPSEYTVFLLERNQYIPYLVLTDNYNSNGKTLLLRKDVLPQPLRINDYYSYYNKSEIDFYLNSDYLSLLSNNQFDIISTSLKISTKSSIGSCGKETETIERKVFLLSCTELGLDDLINCGNEGEPLSFFSENSRVALNGKKFYSWWLRSPNTYFDSASYVIGSNNKVGTANSSDENGIRPAFCVDSYLKIQKSKDVFFDRDVFIFS